MNKEIKLFIKKNPEFELLTNGKIKCNLTGHEMRPDVAELQKHKEV